MKKEAKPKSLLYLFRRKRKNAEGYEYIQHIVSPSHDEGLSTSCWPEYAWRGQSLLDIEKMEYLISINEYYADGGWEVVAYKMEVETPSWSHQPEKVDYKNEFDMDAFEELTEKENQELTKYKQFAVNKYGSKG